MAKAPNLPNVSGQYLSTTQINTAFEAIEEAFENTLSRDGSTPNQMEADLDMNSNDILNVRGIQADSFIVDGEDFSDLLQRAVNEVQAAVALAEMVTFTRVTLTYKGDGTNNPLVLPLSLSDARYIDVFVNETRKYPNVDYTVNGYDLTPTEHWTISDEDNILVLINRPYDDTAPTTDDITYEGTTLTTILRRLLQTNTFYVSDYLHPDDLTAIEAGNTSIQNGSRVTASIRLCLEEALDATFSVDGSSVVVKFPQGIYRINNRLMSDTFNNTLWNAPARARSRMRFRTSGAVTFRVQNWVPGRASMRTDGIYAGSTHIAPHAVFEWFQRSGFQNFGGMEGQWIIEGANNPAGDPVGWYFYRLNATRIAANIECRNLRNRNFVFDSIFNSKFDYVWSANAAGLMLTECGGSGLLPNDTVAGTVRTGLRYTVSGTTLTINTMVYDSAGPSYAYTPYSVFTADHVGKWIALDRQGVDNLLGEDIDDGNEGGSTRRSARWFQIASVTDGATAELTEAPPYQTSTNQWVPQNRTFSFEVLKVSTTAGSTSAALSMPVTQSLVGLEVVIPGAGYDGGPRTLPDLVAMVTAHSGTSITLSHAARISKSGVPFVAAPQAALSSLSHTALAATSRKCDDLHFGRLWCESGTAPGLPLHIHNVTNVTLGDESKLHGSPLNTPNFGANFACVLAGEVGARLAGRFTHSRHSRQFGMFYITGDRSEIKLDGELSSWTADNGSAIWYLDPANVATTRIWDIYYNASDYATGFPNIGGGQVFERGGTNWTSGRIKAGASQRSPRGERPSWPQAVMPAVRSPALGGARADAVSAVARGWVPDEGVPYIVGGGLFEGATGDTSVPSLPGLKGYGPFVTPEMYGAVGDGVTDDTAAFLAALATKRRVVCDGSKAYAVNDLVVGNNEVLDLGEAKLVPFSATCRWLVRLRGFTGGNVSNGLLQDTDNVTVKTATLTAGASAGATSITVDAVGQIEAGMALAIGGTTPGQFAIRKVATASGTTITFDEGIQCDVSNGATVYAAFGLVSIYAQNETIYAPRASGLRMVGGGVHLYQHGTPGSDIAQGFIDNILSQRPVIAQEVIFNNCHDMDRLEIQSRGDRGLRGSATATAGQTTIDVIALCGRPAIGAVFRDTQINLQINDVGQTYTAGAPGAGQYTASADGLTLTVPALTGGEDISLTVFDRPFTSVLYDPHGTGSVQGAHKWLRCLYLQNHSCALFENANNTGGLLHLTQVNYDAGSLWGIRAKDTNKLYLTHVFSGATPYPMIFDLNGSKPDRIVMATGIWTAITTTGHFDAGRVAGAVAVLVNSSGASAAIASDGKPKIRFFGWAGPDFTRTDPNNACAVGSFADMPFQTWGTIRQEAVHSTVPALIQRSMRGSTSAKTAVQNSDVIGRWLVEPHDGTNHAAAGRWQFAATQNHTTSNKGTRAELFVTQNNVSTPAQILTGRIGNDGNPRIEIGASGTAGIICGTGSPEGVVSAVVGSLFLRLDGGAGTSLYVKQSGTGNTGWVGK